MINKSLMKYYIYVIVSVLSAVITFLIMKFAVGSIAVNSLIYSMFTALVSFSITRASWYFINIKEMTAEKKASLVCMGVLNVLSLICVLTSSLFIFRFTIGLIATVVLQSIGLSIMKVERDDELFALNDGDVDGVEIKLSNEELIEYLSANMTYMLIDDEYGNGPDISRPLCQKGASIMTVKEADEAGEGALSASGLEYIKRIVKKRKEV